MRICSFNVNSIRVRLDQVLQYLEANEPDIVGFQETKANDPDFPLEAFTDLGYDVQFYGQKSYNGVAIISLDPPTKVEKGFATDSPDDQKRFIVGHYPSPDGGTIKVVNGYFPQGENRDHPTKFPAKQKFYEDLMTYLQGHSPSDQIVMMGDFNISPEDIDIGIAEHNAKRWLKTGKCSFLPEERAWLGRMKDWGFYDSYRVKYPTSTELFSWFDYRSGGFPERGLRIDQIWLTESLKEKLQGAGIDYDLRKQERPSDHCLIWADLNL